MKKTLAFMLLFLFTFLISITVFAENGTNNEADYYKLSKSNIEVSAKSAVLMEASTGEILFSKNENDALAPASVTKIMTLLLIMEAIDEERISPDAKVIISKNAASMGGSQVFLEEGEEMTVRDLIKCTVIASANDAAVALSEHLYGSEEAFVSAMNEKVAALGMKSSHFENATGLDDTVQNHVTSAKDIAIMSKELIKYPLVLEYSSLWQDTIRDGEFTLTNTNRLVRYYDGCNGLKTGSTDKAGYCISATAKRDGMQLIAVVMGAETRDERNSITRALLDFGFANYAIYSDCEAKVDEVSVYGGVSQTAEVYSGTINKVINKKDKNRVEKYYELPESISAPQDKSAIVGRVKYMIDGRLLCESDVYLKEEIKSIGVLDIFFGILRCATVGKNNK